MREKNFLKHFMVIGVGTILNMILGLLSTPIITRIVNPQQYGQFSIFNTYSGIIVMVLCLGLDQALVRFYYEENTLQGQTSLLYKCIILPFIVSVLFSIIIILLSLNEVIYFKFDIVVLTLLCIYSLVKIIYRFSQLLIRLEYKSKLYSTLNVISKACYLVFGYFFLFFLKRVNAFILLILAELISSVLSLIISIVANRDKWNFKHLDLQASKFKIKELCLYSYPFIFSMGVMTLFEAIDKLSLNMYCTYSEVGIYSSANTIIGIFAIVQTTFNSLWTPISLEHYAKAPNDVSFYQKANRIITLVMFSIGITMILCKDIFVLLLGEEYREAAYIFPFLVFHPIMYTISETTVSGIIFAKKSKAHIIITTVACFTNLVGNTILVPWLGSKGAAISTGISYIVFFIMRTVIANKYFYINFGLKKFFALTVITMFYALYNSFFEFGMISFIGYVTCIILLIAAYKEDFVWCLGYVVNNILKRNHSEEGK